QTSALHLGGRMSRRSGPIGLAALARDFSHFAGWRLWLVGALMVAGALAEGFGLLLIVPLAAIALDQESALPDWIEGPLQSLGTSAGLSGAIALFLIVMASRSLLLFARENLRWRLQTDYQRSLQLRAASTLAAGGWIQASRMGQAGMQSLLLNDVPRATLGISYILEFAVAAIMLTVQLGLAALLSPQMVLSALVVLAPIFFLVRRFTRRFTESGQSFVTWAEDSTNAGMRLQSGLKAALAQGSVPRFLEEYGSSLAGLAGAMVMYGRDLAASRQIMAFSTAVAAVLLLFAGARIFDLPFPILAASLVLFARMAAPAVSLLQSAQQALAYGPAFTAIESRLGPLVDCPRPPSHADAARGPEPLDWSQIALVGAGYRHDSGGGIDGVTLEVGRGEWLGLRGPSAAGKTTFADLIAGLLPPQRGTINIDGALLEGTTLERWQAGLAYVGQDGLVFADSIAANLAADRDAVDEDEMWSALELVGLAERVRAFPDRLHHFLGDRGSSLSGGERQRLLIARAVLRRPSILILDEATAALDPAAEAAILERLRQLDARPAALVIAHRDSTLAYCDSQLSIQHGSAQAKSRDR
ncbi:MAG: ABC transporter ATP-binding protein, partial [Sphingomicrobium sp.]